MESQGYENFFHTDNLLKLLLVRASTFCHQVTLDVFQMLVKSDALSYLCMELAWARWGLDQFDIISLLIVLPNCLVRYFFFGTGLETWSSHGNSTKSVSTIAIFIIQLYCLSTKEFSMKMSVWYPGIAAHALNKICLQGFYWEMDPNYHNKT